MTQHVKLGLKENWKQFTLLVIVNAFVGGMIGMERAIFPQFAASEFHVSSKTAILSFIIAFGTSKAIANYFTGRLANRFGRRNLLLVGWLIAIPIPFLLIYAPNWNWVIFANVLLGLSQGLTWSSTVVMKIDLVGQKDRGLAMGLNEFAGYFAVGIVTFLTGYIAGSYGITPYPFYLGIAISIIGLVLTLFWVKDTRHFVEKESVTDDSTALENVFVETTFKDKTLSSVTQAGLVNNLNDGMIWGLLPIVLLSLEFTAQNSGIIAAVYPTVWGIGQLFTGKMSDVYSKKAMLFWGMLLQGLAILVIPFSDSFYVLALISALLGLGTALVYPTFLSTIAQVTAPKQRAEVIGIFRLWRDFGYAFGALISGITADLFGIEAAIFLIGGLTIISSLIIQFRMPELKRETPSNLPETCISATKIQSLMLKNQKIQFIDVRSKEEYDQGHIPQAFNKPIEILKDELSIMDKDTLYVVACGKGGGRSADAARMLVANGFDSFWLCGGTFGWLKINS